MINILQQHEDSNSSRRMQGKRLLANYEACKFELSRELSLLFQTFESAILSTQDELLNFKLQFRSRALEASIMQSYFAEFLQENFGSQAFYGKYKRLVLRANGYLILFKKLDGKNMPMNIKTGNVQSILSQNQVLDLFAESDYNDEPILYFGYQKDRYGQYVNPQLIYIDEGVIKFSIGKDSMEGGVTLVNSDPVAPPVELTKLRNNINNNRKAN